MARTIRTVTPAEYETMMDAVLSLEPVQNKTRRAALRPLEFSWSDNLRAVWTIPIGMAVDDDYDDQGHNNRPYILRRGSHPLMDRFAADNPKQDLAIFSDTGAPPEIAVATVKAFRDWRVAASDDIAL